MEDKKVLLKVEDLNVKFRVRGRILTAIRGISLDIYEGESIAIVGESGSGKSVFTKTFAGMLDSNGFIDQGRLIYESQNAMVTPGWEFEFWSPVVIAAIISVVLYVVGQNIGDASDPRTHM